jgi:hypothetical protein
METEAAAAMARIARQHTQHLLVILAMVLYTQHLVMETEAAAAMARIARQHTQHLLVSPPKLVMLDLVMHLQRVLLRKMDKVVAIHKILIFPNLLFR